MMISASPYVRYGLALVGALFFLHLVGQLVSDRYAHHTSLDSAKVRLGLKERPAEMWAAGHKLYPWEAPQPEMFEDEEGFNATQAQEDKVKATFVMLARNSDVWGAVESIRGLEGALVSHLNLYRELTPSFRLLSVPSARQFDAPFGLPVPFQPHITRSTIPNALVAVTYSHRLDRPLQPPISLRLDVLER